jgi:hypothetical protein
VQPINNMAVLPSTHIHIQGVSEMYGYTSGACSMHKSNEKCLCKYGSLDASFSGYGPQDHLT